MKSPFIKVILFVFFSILFTSIAISQTVSISDASWTSKSDQDGDGYRRSGILRLNITSNSNFFGYVKMQYVKAPGPVMVVYYTSPSLLIVSGSNYVDFEIGTSSTGGELSNGSYDFYINLYNWPNGNTILAQITDTDNDLNAERFEAASEDIIIPKPIVVTNTASNLTTRSARLNGTVNPNGASATYHFEYGKTTSYGSVTPDVNAGSGTSVLSVMENIDYLEAGVTYHYRIVATNTGGASYGADQSFTTTALSISMSSPSANVTVIQGNSVTLSWSGSPSTASVSLRRDNDNIWDNGTGESNIIVAQSASGSYPWNTAGVPIGKYYIGAYISDGSSQKYAYAPGTVTIGLPKPIVVTNTASNLTTRSARLNGTVNPNGASATYHFEYGKTTSYGSVTPDVNAGSGTSVLSVMENIDYLEAGVTYHYRIVATNTGGASYGADQSFTTTALSISMSSPSANVTVIQGNSVTLSWSGSPSTASVSLRRDNDNIWDNGTGESNIIVAQSASGSYPWNTAGVPIGKYYIGAYISDGSSQKYAYAPGTVTIGLPKPIVVTNTASNLTTRSARLNGTVNPNGASATYHFEYGKTTSYGSVTPDVNAGSGTSVLSVMENIDYLEAGVTYHYRIVATNTGGASYGADQSFTTTALSISMSSPSANVTVIQGNSVTLSWSGSPSTASVSLRRDNDNIWDNGTGESNIIVAQSANGSYSWNTAGVPIGTYYIGAYISDGSSQKYAYAPGTVTIALPVIPAVIVTVDGLDFTNFAIPMAFVPSQTESYLEKAIKTFGISISENDLLPFIWNRDARSTDQHIKNLRSFLRNAYTKAKNENKKFIIISHSWGTFLSYMALSFESTVQTPIEADLFVTLSSPLGTYFAHQPPIYLLEIPINGYVNEWFAALNYSNCDNCYPRANRWVNYWAWGDLVSGPVDNYNSFSINIQVDPNIYNNNSDYRNFSTTKNWHMFTSLQPEGPIDNQSLKDQVKQEILLAIDQSNSDNQPPIVKYNSLINSWYKLNSFFDIDFIDNIALNSVYYQIDSKDDSNPSLWHSLTSDGINILPGSQNNSGTRLTTDWKLSNTDWNNLTINGQNSGKHYIYFKLTDDAGNTYITPDQASAFEIRKDNVPPNISFNSPVNGQVLTSSSVQVTWYADDLMSGLLLSGLDSIYISLDQSTKYTRLEEGTRNYTFNNLSNNTHTIYLKAKDKAGNFSTVKQVAFSTSAVPGANLSIGSVTGGSSVALPVNASGLSDVTAFQFTIAYDNTKLSYVNSTNWSGVSSASNVQETSLVDNGKITFVYNDDPINISNGKLFDLNFTIKKASTGTARVSWSDVPTPRELSNSQANNVLCNYVDGSINIITGFQINGTLNYANSDLTPLSNVSISLLNSTNTSVGNTISNSTGEFSFSGLSNGAYSIKPVIAKPWNGVTAMDITSYKKYIGGAATLTPLQSKSGDVNNSGQTTITDLTIIKQRIGWQRQEFSVGDWLYETPTIYINGSDVTQNIQALCFGDVNGSYSLNELKSSSDAFAVGHDDIKLNENGEFDVPFKLNKTIHDLSSVTLEFTFPSDFLEVKKIEMVSNNEELFYTIVDGTIRMVFSTLNSLNFNNEDLLMTIGFRLKKDINPELSKDLKLSFSGQGEFGDYNDRIIEGVKLLYPSLNTEPKIDIDEILAYPNPTSDILTISHAENSTITIYNLVGKNILEVACNSDKLVIDVSMLSVGPYIAKINKNNKCIIRKFSIIK